MNCMYYEVLFCALMNMCVCCVVFLGILIFFFLCYVWHRIVHVCIFEDCIVVVLILCLFVLLLLVFCFI